MNCKQIANRTATYAVCATSSYEDVIEYFENWIKNYPNSAKDAHCAERLEYFKAQKEEYGTRENYVQKIIEKVTGSKAFEKFSNTIGGVKWHTEIGKDYCGNPWYYVRFTY